MQLQQLVYFVEITELGSINKAAEKLFVTQPSLSKAIANLEDELGVRIFSRTNRGVALTDEGKKLYQYAHTIINQMELIQGLSTRDVPKVLSIASYPIITMGRLVSEFYMTHQQEDITIRLSEQRLQQVIEQVESGEAEIGFIMSNNVQTKEVKHMLNFKNLTFHPLGTDTWYANAGPNCPYYDQDEVTMRQMLQVPFVRMSDDYFSHLTFYLQIDGVRLTEFHRTIHANDSAAILSLLRNTDAMRFGPGISTEDFADYGIRTIPIRNCDVRINVGWIQRKREILSREAQDFVKILESLRPWLKL